MDLKHIFHALQLESPKRILELDLIQFFNFFFFIIFFSFVYVFVYLYFGQDKRTNYFEANSIRFFFILLKTLQKKTIFLTFFDKELFQ